VCVSQPSVSVESLPVSPPQLSNLNLFSLISAPSSLTNYHEGRPAPMGHILSAPFCIPLASSHLAIIIFCRKILSLAISLPPQGLTLKPPYIQTSAVAVSRQRPLLHSPCAPRSRASSYPLPLPVLGNDDGDAKLCHQPMHFATIQCFMRVRTGRWRWHTRRTRWYAGPCARSMTTRTGTRGALT
jgi:hypothetical protein